MKLIAQFTKEELEKLTKNNETIGTVLEAIKTQAPVIKAMGNLDFDLAYDFEKKK